MHAFSEWSEYPEAMALFGQLVQFSELAAGLSAKLVVGILNENWCALDRVANKHQV